MTLGEAIIEELEHRQQLGMYFSEEGYRRLPAIENEVQLKGFLSSERFEDVPTTTTVRKIVDSLDSVTRFITGEDIMFFFALGVIGRLDSALLALPFFYAAYIACRRRRPRRQPKELMIATPSAR